MRDMTKKRFLQEVTDLHDDLARRIEHDRLALIGNATLALLTAGRPVTFASLHRELEAKEGAEPANALLREIEASRAGRTKQ